MTEAEALAGLRVQGLSSAAEAVVLEASGELSVLRNTTPGPQSVLKGVTGARNEQNPKSRWGG